MKLTYAMLAAFLLSCNVFGAIKFTGNDISRILYQSDDPSTFLVLKKITNQGDLRCSYYKQKKLFTVTNDTLRKTFFFEQTSAFVITQYLLYYHTNNISSEYLLPLANKVAGSTERMKLYNEYMQKKNVFMRKYRRAQAKADEESDIDDKLDILHEVIDNCDLDQTVLQAADTSDWILTVTLLKDYRELMRTVARSDSGKRFLYKAAIGKSDDLEKEILSGFTNYQSSHNSQFQSRFKTLYPNSRSLWDSPAPDKINDLYKLHAKCLQAYLKLDKLSSLAEPEKWGTAMLNSLMLIENSSVVTDLKEAFESEMTTLEQFNANKKPINNKIPKQPSDHE